MRMPGIWELKDRWDWLEVTAFSAGTFPEPLAFSMRAWDHLRDRSDDFDLVQDNQCLGYGLLAMERSGLPVLGTIHHPITVDRRLEMEHAETPWATLGQGPLVRVHQDADPRGVATAAGHHRVEELLRGHRAATTRCPPSGCSWCRWGSTRTCSPRCPMSSAARNQIISTASSDVAMKGQRYLLEALAKLRADRPELTCDW